MNSTRAKRLRLPAGPRDPSIGPKVIETVRLAAEGGLSNQEIAALRHCSVYTVNNQLQAFYDFAKTAIADETFWRRFRSGAQLRQGLPEIWRRVQASLAARGRDEDQAQPASPGWTSDEQSAGLPAARCRQLWGREDLLDEVAGTLRQSGALRIVLLAAFGGYGKTEFARALAEHLITTNAFKDAAWGSLKGEEFYFTLGNISPAPLSFVPSRVTIVRTLLDRLSCRSEDELRNRLGSAAILIVVDNLETLPPAEREAVVGDLHRLLGAGPSRAIVTSRVDVLAPYLYKPAFGGLSPAASEVLLRDEAHNFPRASELRTASPDVIRQIWALTNGMPLALHLVVGQSQRYELSQVITTLEEARASGADDALHLYLCEQAWRELSRAARALLVFMATAARAPQTSAQLLALDLAADVRFEGKALHHALGEITSWFLVGRSEPREAGQAISYGLHPLIRAFVLSDTMRARWEAELKLTEDALREAAVRKHDELLQRGLGRHGSAATQDAALVSRAVPDFLHSMYYYVAHQQPQRVLWYWEWISEYLWRYGRYAEYVECDQYALAAAEQVTVTDPTEGRRLTATISAELAFAHLELGEPALAERSLQRAEQLFRQLDDPVEVARVLRYHANLRCRLGDCDAGERLCREALRVLDEFECQGQDNQVTGQQGPIHTLLGIIYIDQGKDEAARKEFLTALKAARKRGEDKVYWSLAPRRQLGYLHERRSRIGTAKRYYRQCLALTADGTSPNVRAEALVNLARLVAREGDGELARDLAQQAIKLYEAMGKHSDQMKAVRFLETLANTS